MCDVIFRVLMECDHGEVHSIFPFFGTENFDDIQQEIREPLDEKEKKQALRVLGSWRSCIARLGIRPMQLW